MTYYSNILSPLGQLLMLSDGQALTGLYFDGQKHMPEIQATWQHNPTLNIFNIVATQLSEYFAGTRKDFQIPFRFIQGTHFQQRVWHELAKTTYGSSQSYSGLAKLIGSPKAIRAAAGAVARNPFVLIIPCHRIVGIDGSLTGFAAGLHRKKALVELERMENKCMV